MNEFLKLLLPWQKTPNDQISDIFVYGIFALFGILSVIFLWKTILRIRLISSLNKKIDKLGGEYGRPADPGILNELEEIFNRSDKFFKPFNKAWQEFKESLITPERRKVVYKTDEASLFFSEDRLLGQYMNLRFWNSVPALLVGLGILGTFVGLIWGLFPFSDIDFEETSEIRGAIKILLSGVSTAFVTSVWGMLASLSFNWLEKGCINMICRKVANLQGALDLPFTLKTQEEIAAKQKDELEQQTAIFKTLFTDLGDSIKKTMREGRQEILDELNKTVEAFSTAITDMLEPSIKNLQTSITDSKDEIIRTMVEERQEIISELKNMPDAFSQAVTKQLDRSLDKLNETVEKLRQEKDESSTEAIRELVEEFKNALSGSFTKEIETLVKELSTVSQSLIDLPTRMENMMEGVQKKIDDICESLKNATDTQTRLTEETMKGILGELRSAITELKSAIDSITSAASTESTEMIKSIRDSVDAAAVRLNGIFEEGETRVSILLDKQGKLIEAVDLPISKSKEAVETGNVLLQRVNTSLDNANEMIETMQAFSNQLKGSANTLITAGENLTQASTAFNKQNEEYLSKNRETNESIQESLQQSQKLLNEFAGKFETIESGLQGIFAEINNGLIKYSTTTHDSIEKSLDAFTKELTTAAEALAGSVSALDSSVEELSEMMSEIIERFPQLRGVR